MKEKANKKPACNGITWLRPTRHKRGIKSCETETRVLQVRTRQKFFTEYQGYVKSSHKTLHGYKKAKTLNVRKTRLSVTRHWLTRTIGHECKNKHGEKKPPTRKKKTIRKKNLTLPLRKMTSYKRPKNPTRESDTGGKKKKVGWAGLTGKCHLVNRQAREQAYYPVTSENREHSSKKKNRNTKNRQEKGKKGGGEK